MAAAATLPAAAAPLSYFVNFTDGSPKPTTGLLTYDDATSSFSNFFVSWNGHLFDLTAAANAPSVGGGCPGTSSSPATGFALMTKSLCGGLYDRWFAADDFGSSRFAFSSQTVALPEKNGASISGTASGSGTFSSTSAAGDWSLGTPFAAPGGTPIILADGTVIFPGGAIFIEGKGLLPINHRIDFTGVGTLPSLGLFDYDAAASTFHSFFVLWNGRLFDLTAAANAPSVGGACPGLTPSAATSFALMSKTLCAGLYDRWFASEDFSTSRFAFSSQTLALPERNGALISATEAGSGVFANDFGSGDWSLTAIGNVAAVPEPETYLLFLATLPFLGIARRRRQSRRVEIRSH